MDLNSELSPIIESDEAIIEAGANAIKKELWKGELMSLLKGLRGKEGWAEDRRGVKTDYTWSPGGHNNYLIWLRVTNTAPPTFGLYIDPDLRVSTTGFRSEREIKNYKAILKLPKSLQEWVLADLKKTGNTPRDEATLKVVSLGVPHDMERA
jgi:hypothetical protein